MPFAFLMTEIMRRGEQTNEAKYRYIEILVVAAALVIATLVFIKLILPSF